MSPWWRHLAKQGSRGNDFNNAVHLLYCQCNTEPCQQAGQLDVHLKMASQVVRPCVFWKHMTCNLPCRHIERALWGPELLYFLFLATVADVLFTQNQDDMQSSHLDHTHARTLCAVEIWLQTYIKSLCGSCKPSWSLSGLLSQIIGWIRCDQVGKWLEDGRIRILKTGDSDQYIHSFPLIAFIFFAISSLSGYCCLIMPTQNLHFN